MFDSKKLNLPAADQHAPLLLAFSRLQLVSELAALFHLHFRINHPDDYFFLSNIERIEISVNVYCLIKFVDFVWAVYKK